MDDLKNEVLEFFKSRIASIKRSEEIKELVYTQLVEEIQGGELNHDQLMGVLRQLGHENTSNTDVIFSLFRSGQGGTSLSDIMRSAQDANEIAQAFNNYTPEQLQKIDQTMRIIRSIIESSENATIEDTKKDV
jgi:hypothetical protein